LTDRQVGASDGHETLEPTTRAALLHRYVKFCIVGLSSTVVYFGVSEATASVSGADMTRFWPRNVILAIAFILSAINGYIWNRLWTFRSTDPQRARQLTKFVGISAVGLLLNNTIVTLGMHTALAHHLGEPRGRYLSMAVAIVLVSVWNFSMNSVWTFGRGAKLVIPDSWRLRDPERRWVFILALVVMTITLIPPLFGWAITPQGARFAGSIFSPTDEMVHFAWMKQAGEGRFIIENRFTTDAQNPRLFNVYLFVLGLLARVMHIPAPIIYHIGRWVFGVWLIMLVHRFTRLFFEEEQTRKIAMVLVAVSSGVGWMMPPFMLRGIGPRSVDAWQPESNTFLSLAANGMFPVSLCLMVGVFLFSLRSGSRQTTRDLIWAGVLLLLLGNIHSYDWITVVVVLIVHAVVRVVRQERGGRWPDLLLRAREIAIIVAISIPAVAYQYYAYRVDPVFAARAQVPTPSANFAYVLTGLGLPLLPALFVVPVALFGLRRRRVFLVCWMLAGLAIPYIPVAFQRKLLMGVHIPVALLAAYGLVQFRWFRFKERLPAIVAGIVLLTGMTNVFHVIGDARAVRDAARTPDASILYASAREMGPIRWLARHAETDSRVLCTASMGLHIPALTSCRVYAGHWGETPHFKRRADEALSFLMGRLGVDADRQLLDAARIDYIVQPRALLSLKTYPAAAEGLYIDRRTLRAYVRFLDRYKQVYSDNTYAIYHVPPAKDRG
jgi:putative flippase GtrA